MIEVELKAHVRDRRALRLLLLGFAEEKGAVDKLDEYWRPPLWRENSGIPGFRVREEAGAVWVTRKEKRVDAGIESNRETEFQVSDRAAFEVFAKALGCEPSYSKHKRGEAFSAPSEAAASGRALIELVEVVGLGDFLEIEVLVAEGDPSAAARAAGEVRTLLGRCGVPESEIESRFYSELLAESGLAAAPVSPQGSR